MRILQFFRVPRFTQTRKTLKRQIHIYRPLLGSSGEKFIDFKLLNKNSIYEAGTCPGCGAGFHMEEKFGAAGYVSKLQRTKSKDIPGNPRPNAPVYAKPDATELISPQKLKVLLDERSGKNDVVLCDRCYNLKFKCEENGRIFPVNLPSFFEPIRKKQSGVVLLVIDATDASSTLVPNIQELVGRDKPVVVLVNKCDALPESAQQKYVKQWILNEFRKKNKFQPKPEHIFFSSAKTGEGVFEAMVILGRLRRSEDDHIYLVGHTNVGKSHLVSSLWRLIGDSEQSKLLVSHSPGTTAGYLKLPLRTFRHLLLASSSLDHGQTVGVSDKARLVDTPGLEISNSFASLLTLKELRMAEFKVPIKPSSIPLKAGQTLFIGGLARIDLLACPTYINVTTFISNNILVHRTSSETADLFYEKHFAALKLTPPCGGKERRESWPAKFNVRTVELVNRNGKKGSVNSIAELNLPGIGWVGFNDRNFKTATIKIHFPEGIDITLREPMLPVAHHTGRKGKIRNGPRRPFKKTVQKT